MKYINIIRITILNVILTLSLTGCSDWLRIEPVDAILDDQIYTSEYNTQVTLNGIYLKMASEPLYGKELTNWSIELIAQQYAVSIGSKTSNPLKYYMNSYTYSDEVAKNRILKIWSDAYSTVLNINYFIKRLDATEGIVSKKNKDIMLGEAYGLRAFMHFDMLRLFGPIYQTDSTSLSIPYYSDATIVLREREAANVIMDKIFIDIDRALEYLKEDPVIKEGAMAMTTDLSTYQYQFDEFYHFRNRRMNYYAVSALKARALLYRENKEEAAAVALSLLDNTTLSQHFPWVKKEDVDKNDMEDRIASPEVLFGIHSASMYSIWNLNFSPGVHFDAFLGATQVNVKYAFDMATTELALSTDYRASNWKLYNDATYMSLYKFSKSSKVSNNWNYQPLIRKSELYYIIAEALDNKDYIDEVRINRGLKKLSEAKPNSTIATELLLEHMREFYGEGQLFYFYKRRNLKSIRNGSTAGNITMSADKYVLPIPQVELDK